MTNNLSNFCGSGDITKIYIVEPLENTVINGMTATTILVTGDFTVEGNIYNCDSGSTAFFNIISACTDVITVGSDLVPIDNASIYVGTTSKRYREVNTVSGYSSIWASTIRVITPEVTLGYDNDGELRILNANSSIMVNDRLNGGSY